jgi:hypothetical protein
MVGNYELYYNMQQRFYVVLYPRYCKIYVRYLSLLPLNVLSLIGFVLFRLSVCELGIDSRYL